MLAAVLRKSPVVLALGLFAAGAIVLARGTEPGSEPTEPQPASFDPALVEPVELSHESKVFLLRAGLSADALAAAGIDTQGFNALMQHAEEDCPSARANLASADSSYADARRTRDELQREVRSGLASPEEVSQLAEAKTAFEAQATAREAILDGFRSGACEEVSTGVADALEQIFASERWGLPMEFRVVSRSEAQWIRLRDALVEEKGAERLGVEPNPELASVLATERANEAVAAAKANLDANLASIQSAWDASFAE